MKSKRRTAIVTIVLSASIVVGFGIFGAYNLPTGVNIAAAIVITLSLLIETPLTAMALAKHKHSK